MTGQATATAENDLLCLPRAALARMMPMHAIVGASGHILSTGPTLAKVGGACGLAGRRFLEVFEVRRPRNVARIADLGRPEGVRLNLRLRERPGISLKGRAEPLPEDGGLLINLSFGIAAVEAVATYGLTSADFSQTDLTVELLYLVEAKQAVIGESRNLNLRLQGARIAAEEQAFTDTLTGLKNRRAMDTVLDRYASRSDPFALMHLDLDYFKDVNDTLGHAAGDHVLQAVARILVEETRGGDTVVRAGGDEFVLIFHGMTSAAALGRVAGRLLKRLEQPIMFGDAPCRISGSIGIAISDDYARPDPAQMLIDADRALYASKSAGRARHTFVHDLDGTGTTC